MTQETMNNPETLLAELRANLRAIGVYESHPETVIECALEIGLVSLSEADDALAALPSGPYDPTAY